MNKNIIIGLLISVTIGLFSLAYYFTIGKNVVELTSEDCFEIDEKTGKITAYKDLCDVEVNIPEKIKGKTVKEIGSFVFSSKGIKKIILPDTLEVIGIGAFSDNEIEKVIIPENVKTIKSMAFKNNKIKKLEIGSKVSNIGIAAFNNNQLKGDSAFIYMRTEKGIDETVIIGYAGSERKKVKIPEQTTMIYLNAFTDCDIESVNFNKNLERIEGRAFENNKLTKITLPKSVIIVNQDAFNNNPLKEIEVLGKKSISDFSNFDLESINEDIIKFNSSEKL